MSQISFITLNQETKTQKLESIDVIPLNDPFFKDSPFETLDLIQELITIKQGYLDLYVREQLVDTELGLFLADLKEKYKKKIITMADLIGKDLITYHKFIAKKPNYSRQNNEMFKILTERVFKKAFPNIDWTPIYSIPQESINTLCEAYMPIFDNTFSDFLAESPSE